MAIDLAPDERILWQGQPVQGFRLAPQDAFAIPVALFWVMMALTIAFSVITGRVQPVDPLSYVVMTVFLAIGIYILVGRFLVDRAARRRIRYYLTDQRAVIEGGTLRGSRRSVSLASVSEIQFQGRGNRRGTVQFGPATMAGIMPPSWPGASRLLPPAFADIEEADQVYNLALEAQRAAQARRG